MTESTPACNNESFKIGSEWTTLDCIDPVHMIHQSKLEIIHSRRRLISTSVARGSPYISELKTKIIETLIGYLYVNLFFIALIDPYAWFKDRLMIDLKVTQILKTSIPEHVIPYYD